MKDRSLFESASVTGANRRPARARDHTWVRWLAGRLAVAGATPNQVSLASVLFAGLASVCLLLAAVTPIGRPLLFLTAAALLPFRGLCNLCDGLIAVEGGRRTRAGVIFNDLPDRLSDALLLAAAGVAISAWWGRDLGWLAALLALGTAYVRVLGGSAGTRQPFCGPMDKSARMVILGLAAVLAAAEAACGWPERSLTAGLAAIAIGSLLTIIRRTRRILRELDGRPATAPIRAR
jgi:phosphatidylglycerophosphate synthase